MQLNDTGFNPVSKETLCNLAETIRLLVGDRVVVWDTVVHFQTNSTRAMSLPTPPPNDSGPAAPPAEVGVYTIQQLLIISFIVIGDK